MLPDFVKYVYRSVNNLERNEKWMTAVNRNSKISYSSKTGLHYYSELVKSLQKYLGVLTSEVI